MKNFNLYKRVFIFTLIGCLHVSIHARSNVSAKMAIVTKSGPVKAQIKNRQKLNFNNPLGLIISTNKKRYLYIVISDKKQYRLLHQQTIAANKKIEILNEKELQRPLIKYNNRDKIRLLIFLSNKKLKEMNSFTQSTLSKSGWKASENTLVARGRSISTHQIKKPASVAANMRSMNPEIVLKKYSGGAELLSVIVTINVQKN